MPSFTRMKIDFLKGLLWLILFRYGHMVLSLEPGFLDFDNLPDTNFTCVGKVIGGYYADLETNCQMFHVCTIGQADEPMDIRFLCLNGTVFDQETRVCERIDEVDCSKSEGFYSLNLELYGNTGPILEESPEVPQETEPPSIISTSTTPTTTATTTTTTASSTTRKSSVSHAPYYTTTRPLTTTTLQPQPPAVAGHHFPANPDIRFNPEEINISLNPGAPPDIRTNRFGVLSDSSQILVNNNNNNNNRHEELRKPQLASSTSKTIYAIDASDSDKLPQNSDSYEFDDAFASTSVPLQQQQQFLIQTNTFRHSQSYPQNANSQYHQPQYHSTTIKQFGDFSHHTTSRTIYLPKEPHVHQHHQFAHHARTEKTPRRVQIPIPRVPTLPPLTFSSPAPFTLQRHVETKRYIKDHGSPPRIIISASASVSDASGRRLNYSLGTIGAHNILEAPPSSYDDYKDGDVGLDPFYHDVPKVKHGKRRRKRSSGKEIDPFEIIKNEKEAVEVLKFLFKWYQSHQATATVPPATSPNYAAVDVSGPVTPELIKEINELDDNIETSDELVGDKINLDFSDKPSQTDDADVGFIEKMDNIETTFAKEHDFDPKESVDDNYESEMYKGVAQVNESTEVEKYLRETTPKDVLSGSQSKEVIDGTTSNNSEWPIKNDFDPNDYVDDNYEPIVYKESDANTNKDNELKELENEKLVNKENVSDGDEAKKISLNKEINMPYSKNYSTDRAVSEFYKYFNVTSSSQKENWFNDTTTTENIVTSQTELDIPSKTDEEVEKPSNDFMVKEDVNQPAISELYNFTDPNSLNSENNSEKIEINEGKQTDASTTTSTTTAPKYTVRKRGRGRQRFIDSQQEASFKLGVSKNRVESLESKNYISDPARSVKSRGRSRFSVASKLQSSTSATTIIVDPLSATVPSVEEVSSAIQPASTTDVIEDQRSFGEDDDAYRIKKPNKYAFLDVSVKEGNNGTAVKRLPNPIADSAYGIQLLRYFAQSVIEEENVPTEPSSVASYEPMTEIARTTTPVYVTPIHKSHGVKNRYWGRYRHSTRVSTTALPTLRDINDGAKLVDEKTLKIDVGDENISTIEETSTDSSIIDTTVTTPLAYVDENESFGTTVLSITELTNPAQYTTETTDRTETFTLSTTEPYNLSNDVLTVPERNSTENSDASMHETKATIAPDVEIQKSISLPISVLQPSLSLDHSHVQDINSLANNEINNTPSTETTIFHEMTLTTASVTDATTLLATQEPLYETTKLEMPGMVNSSRLYQILLENTTSDEAATLSTTTTVSPYPTRRARPTKRRPQDKKQNLFGRHRFSTELFTNKPPNMTDTPLPRSASPTRADLKKVSLITTPLSSKGGNPGGAVRVGKNYVFNCFGKDVNKFYADPRDCRLFHYCTNGYSKNQLLDLKYVCDRKTFFDEDKLICSKVKPEKCS